MVDAYARRRADDERLSLINAWHAAAFARQKRLPSLDRIMNRKPARAAPYDAAAAAARLKAALSRFPAIHTGAVNGH